MKFKPLSDLCDLNMGQSPSSNSYNQESDGIPFFQGNADFGELHPTVRYWCNQPTKIANANDILISVRAPIGALNIATGKCCIGRGLAALTAKEGVSDTQYMFYALRSRVDELNASGTGSTFKAISKSILGNTQIPAPDVNKQQKISANLNKASELITLRKQQLKKLDLIVKSRFVEMFGDPVTNPMGWETKKLDAVCNGIGDGLHGTPKYNENGDYYFINGSNLIDGKIVITASTQKVDGDEYKKHGIMLDHNTIFISINGSLGKIAFYNGEKLVLGKSACYCRLKPVINKTFVFGVMNSEAFQKYIKGEATASTINNVSLKTMREYPLIVPPLPFQNRFADFVRQADKSKFEIQQGLEKLELQYNALMQQYFG